MIRNYVKIAWRNLWKNRIYSAINVGGLAIGLVCCITIGLYVWDEYRYDRFHDQADQLYRVVEQQDQSGTLYNIAVTPGPLAPALKTDFAEVHQTCRLGKVHTPTVLQHGPTTVEPKEVRRTDNAFFHLFAFKLLMGNPQTVLLGPTDVVLSESLAEQLFGPAWRRQANLLGRPIQLNNNATLTLVGVAENPPTNSHIQYDVLLSTRADELNPDRYQWSSNSYHTYIRLGDQANVAALNGKLTHYLQKYQPGSKTTLSLEPLLRIYLHSNFAFGTDWSKTSQVIYCRIFTAVGLIVLLIALFNFVNLATAQAVGRAREVGVRKAAGALREQLAIQFISESMLMTLLAVGLAFVLLPVFVLILNATAAKSIAVPLGSAYFWVFLGSLTLVVGVLAGVYPAFYLTRFQPVKVLKGVFAAPSGQLFRRTLVVGQFTFSVILVVGALVIYRQLTFLQDQNLGFDQSQLLYVWLKQELPQKAGLLKADLAQQSSVRGVTAVASNLVDLTSSTSSLKWEGQLADDQFLMTQTNVDADFIPTVGMSLLAGRNFSGRITSDTASAYLINETAAKRMGWTAAQAIGKRLKLWDRAGQIIGVVNDFHFRPLTATIEPFLFRYWPKESYPALLVRTKPGQTQQALASLTQLYKRYDRLTALDYAFVDEALDKQYRVEQRTGRIVLYFAVLAIFVSCLGLFGLATFTAEQRTKEIGIRKALGASVGSIVTLLSTDFVKLVGIAIVIASPVAWYTMHRWLESFAYRIAIEWWVFAGAGLLAIGIALLTVSFQSVKAALTNPVKSLRSE